MSVSFAIRNSIAEVVATGKTSADDLNQAFEGLFDDEAYEPGMGVLVFGGETPFLPTVSELRAASKLFASFELRKDVRLALVEEATVRYGLGRILEAYCGFRGVNLRVFKTESEARLWLASGSTEPD